MIKDGGVLGFLGEKFLASKVPSQKAKKTFKTGKASSSTPNSSTAPIHHTRALPEPYETPNQTKCTPSVALLCGLPSRPRGHSPSRPRPLLSLLPSPKPPLPPGWCRSNLCASTLRSRSSRLSRLSRLVPRSRKPPRRFPTRTRLPNPRSALLHQLLLVRTLLLPPSLTGFLTGAKLTIFYQSSLMSALLAKRQLHHRQRA